jgi:hypothetical protein
MISLREHRGISVEPKVEQPPRAGDKLGAAKGKFAKAMPTVAAISKLLKTPWLD